jgi:hypothetical protein
MPDRRSQLPNNAQCEFPILPKPCLLSYKSRVQPLGSVGNCEFLPRGRPCRVGSGRRAAAASRAVGPRRTLRPRAVQPGQRGVQRGRDSRLDAETSDSTS